MDLGTGSWDAATATRVAEAFLPPDAQHLRDVAGEHVDQSAELKASLVPTHFLDEVTLTTPAPPGRLKWTCSPNPSNAPGFGLCDVSTHVFYSLHSGSSWQIHPCVCDWSGADHSAPYKEAMIVKKTVRTPIKMSKTPSGPMLPSGLG